MALYRCAACGSPNVVTDTQTGGVTYNYKKGIVGTVVLGVGGAAAGIESKTQQVYKCQDCGMTLSYSMPENLKNAIDRGLISEDARSFLYAEGFGQLSWSVLRKQYKNIEEGFADRLIADRENRKREGLLAYATATQEEFDKAVDLIVDFERRFSCNGSIYDTLPDDAFSDTKPMTLMEYYVWQDAIALFIENVAKYLRYPLAKYRGLSEHNMKEYFLTYLYEKVRIEYGHYPVFTGFMHCDDFKNYAEDHPFVLYFADKYFGRTWTPFGTMDTKVIPWEPENFGHEIARQSALRSCMTNITLLYKFKDTNGEELIISRKVPRYIVKDGRLAFWRESNPHNRTPDAAGTLEDYFSVYPDKRSEFDSKVAAQKQQVSSKGQVETQVRSLTSAITQNESTIKAKKEEIVRLQNKIFGKKKALAQVDVLENEIRTIQANIDANSAKVKTLQVKLAAIVDDETFYEQLTKDMDNFVVLRWVDDEERIPFWMSEEERRKYKQLHSSLTNMEIQAMIMETLKQIGTEVAFSDILKANTELEDNCTVVKLAVMLRQLNEGGKVQRVERDGKSYYSIT